MELVRKLINRKEVLNYKLKSYEFPAINTGQFLVEDKDPFILVITKTLIKDPNGICSDSYKILFEIIKAPTSPADMNKKKDAILVFTAYLPANDDSDSLLKTLCNMYKRDSKIKVDYNKSPTRAVAKIEMFDGTNTDRVFISTDPYEHSIVHKFKVEEFLIPSYNIYLYNDIRTYNNAVFGRDKLKPYLEALRQHNIHYSIVQAPVYGYYERSTTSVNSSSVYIICVTDKSKQDKLGELKKNVLEFTSTHPDSKEYKNYFDTLELGWIDKGPSTYTIYLYTGVNGNNLPIFGIDKFNVSLEYREQILDILRS